MDEKDLKKSARILASAAEAFDSCLKNVKKHEGSSFLLVQDLKDGMAALNEEELLQQIRMGREWMSSRLQEVKAGLADYQALFGGDLETALAGGPYPLRGRWPSWRYGPFEIQTRGERGDTQISWGPGGEPCVTCGLEPAEVADAVTSLLNRLETAHQPEVLPGRLLVAYKLACTLSGKPLGEAIPIKQVFNFMATLAQGESFQEKPSRNSWKVDYDRVQMSYDLGRLRTVEVDGLHLILRVATRDQTKVRGMTFWLPDDNQGNGTLFATIQFQRR